MKIKLVVHAIVRENKKHCGASCPGKGDVVYHQGHQALHCCFTNSIIMPDRINWRRTNECYAAEGIASDVNN